jgi:hypothetical protein
MVPVSPLTVEKCQSVQNAARSMEYAPMAIALAGTGAAMVVFGRVLIKSNTILGQAVVNTQLTSQPSTQPAHQRNQVSLHQRNQSSLRSLHQRNQVSNQPKKQKMLTRKLWPRPEDVF